MSKIQSKHILHKNDFFMQNLHKNTNSINTVLCHKLMLQLNGSPLLHSKELESSFILLYLSSLISDYLFFNTTIICMKKYITQKPTPSFTINPSYIVLVTISVIWCDTQCRCLREFQLNKPTKIYICISPRCPKV